MISETIRKQMLVAEVLIMIDKLSQSDPSLELPDRESLDGVALKELESIKRELERFCRSLGGVS